MLALVLVASLASVDPAPLRVAVAEVALAQAKKQDPKWHPDQRDCAGLVRFAYRSAYKRLRPERLQTPLFEDARGTPLDFADAQTLLSGSFEPLGRGAEAKAGLRSGDLVAFRQEDSADGAAQFHLMLVVRTRGDAGGEALVVYHPGSKGAAVRVGTLDALAIEAPLEWRPVADNGRFLGFFRFKEWTR